MQLDEAELRDLSAFFARRFPSLDDRARLARAAGFDAPADAGDAAWTDLVTRVHASGRLGRMVHAALRLRPDDTRLKELAALIPAPPRWPLVLGAAALALVGLILAVGPGAEPTPPITTPVAVAPAEAAPIVAEPAVAAPVEAAPAPAVVVAPAAPVETQPTPAAVPARTEPAAPTRRAGRCAAPAGQLVGYWYAGATSPGHAGETITLRAGATVRSDYPRAENKYNFRFPERCALVAGDLVRLSQAPIAVTGGVYWVPLMGGDLAAAVE